MELLIFSGLLAAFGAGAIWATRPTPLAQVQFARQRELRRQPSSGHA